MQEIPIIDMSEIGEIEDDVGNNVNWISLAGKIREHLGNFGFIYLKNFGMNVSMINSAFTTVKTFFDLTLDDKLKYKKQPLDEDSNAWCGYSEAVDELLLHPSPFKELLESYDIFYGVGTYPDEEVPDFKSIFSSMYDVCNSLAKKFLVLFAISLTLEPNFFLNHCTHIDDSSLPRACNMRVLHYPPIPCDMDLSPGIERLEEHSDYGLLTFLFQDTNGGLEVKTNNGKWIKATPIPGTILINTGDLLEIWSSGIYPATKHRVVLPRISLQKYSSRYSIAYFLMPNVDTKVETLNVMKTESEEERLEKSSRRKDGVMGKVSELDYVLCKFAESFGRNHRN
ncbi:Proline hydroxylase buaE [Pseudolycoriella hygida]|uniref:Proline hydroxylase buaE n=1 Tax=Pseudolycoriella hygida TaxID=35572 RepID=A0A9Q0N7R6_9DIPT|nr:Proline hydroxylase buaE [Pseudolycoriella hygida]